MPDLSQNLIPLKEHEIAGADTINRMLTYILGMRPISQYLMINPNGRGSITFDLDFEGLLADVLKAVEALYGNASEDFRMTATGNGVSVAAGRVYWSDTYADIAGATFPWSADDDIIYVKLTGLTTGTLEQGNVTHTVRTTNGEHLVTLPLARMVKTGDDWHLHRIHRGAFVFVMEPYFLLPGWSRGRAQTLDHLAGADGYRWQDYGDCDQSDSGSGQ